MFLGRNMSYHGNTLSTLSVGHHPVRRAPYEAIIDQQTFQHVSFVPLFSFLWSSSAFFFLFFFFFFFFSFLLTLPFNAVQRLVPLSTNTMLFLKRRLCNTLADWQMNWKPRSSRLELRMWQPFSLSLWSGLRPDVSERRPGTGR